MEHKDHFVDLVDDQGIVIGKKPRQAVDKKSDLYHGVHLLLINPRGELILATVPDRKDLPNLYANRLGTTVATIRRSDESPEQAAKRAAAHDIFLDKTHIHHLGDAIFMLPSTSKPYYMSAYYAKGKQPAKFSLEDIADLKTINAEDLHKLIQDKPDKITPTLEFLWRSYAEQLPVS